MPASARTRYWTCKPALRQPIESSVNCTRLLPHIRSLLHLTHPTPSLLQLDEAVQELKSRAEVRWVWDFGGCWISCADSVGHLLAAKVGRGGISAAAKTTDTDGNQIEGKLSQRKLHNGGLCSVPGEPFRCLYRFHFPFKTLVAELEREKAALNEDIIRAKGFAAESRREMAVAQEIVTNMSRDSVRPLSLFFGSTFPQLQGHSKFPLSFSLLHSGGNEVAVRAVAVGQQSTLH